MYFWEVRFFRKTICLMWPQKAYAYIVQLAKARKLWRTGLWIVWACPTGAEITTSPNTGLWREFRGFSTLRWNCDTGMPLLNERCTVCPCECSVTFLHLTFWPNFTVWRSSLMSSNIRPHLTPAVRWLSVPQRTEVNVYLYSASSRSASALPLPVRRRWSPVC